MRFEDENGNWIKFDENFPSNHYGTYKKHGKWAIPVFPSVATLVGSPKTPYIFEDHLDFKELAKAMNQSYEMSTDEFKTKWDGRIDFLFIDADHSYRQVRDDFFGLIKWVPFFKGLVLLHDTCPLKELAIPERAGDAWKFAKELHRKYSNFEIVTLPGPTCGLSIVRKVTTMKHLEWENEN
jgi:hypothetical protein